MVTVKNFVILPVFLLKCHWILNNSKSTHTAEINKPIRKTYTGRWHIYPQSNALRICKAWQEESSTRSK